MLGSMKQAIVNTGKIFTNDGLVKKTVCKMQKTVLMDSKTTTWKVLSRLIQN